MNLNSLLQEQILKKYQLKKNKKIQKQILKLWKSNKSQGEKTAREWTLKYAK